MQEKEKKKGKINWLKRGAQRYMGKRNLSAQIDCKNHQSGAWLSQLLITAARKQYKFSTYTNPKSKKHRERERERKKEREAAKVKRLALIYI